MKNALHFLILISLFHLPFLMIQLPTAMGAEPETRQTAMPSRACSVCGRSREKQYFKIGEEFFCSEACMGKKYFCSSCGVTLGTSTNPTFQSIVDIHENTLFFCPRCMRKSGCVYCGSRKGTLTANGQTVCDSCREMAINRAEDALPLLREAQKLLKERFGFPVNPNLKLEVISRPEFTKRTRGSGLPSNARAARVSRMEIVSQLSPDGKTLTIHLKNVDAGMLIVAGAPSASVFDSIVHELTHDFLRRDGNFIDDRLVEEGFCEAIAGISSLLRGNPSLAKKRLKNPDPIYGDGFRKMYGMLRQKGWNETMKFIDSRTNSRKDHILKNLFDCINPAQAEYIRQNRLNPKIVFTNGEGENP